MIKNKLTINHQIQFLHAKICLTLFVEEIKLKLGFLKYLENILGIRDLLNTSFVKHFFSNLKKCSFFFIYLQRNNSSRK